MLKGPWRVLCGKWRAALPHKILVTCYRIRVINSVIWLALPHCQTVQPSDYSVQVQPRVKTGSGNRGFIS